MLHHRIGHWRAILGRSIWFIVAGAPFAITGFFVFIRDEFLPPEWQEKLKMPHWLPEWQWQTWLVLAIVVFLFAVLESSYRISRKIVDDRDEAQNLLKEVSITRTLEFSGINFNVQVKEPNLVAIIPVMIFANLGDHALNYRITEISASINGIENDKVKDVVRNTVMITGQGKRSFTFPAFDNVSLVNNPLRMTIHYLIEYDNIPPIRQRITGRTIEWEIASLNPMMCFDRILEEIEK